MAGGGPRGSAGIKTPDQRLRVFVSSTLQELGPERGAARAAIEQLRLAPVMFESGARPHPAREVYRAYIAQSDIFVGIYWQQYGWVGPQMTVSGLEDEFALSAGMPRLLYLKSPAPDMAPGLARMLDQVRTEGGVAYRRFADAEELRELLLTDLVTVLTERFGVADPVGPGYLIPSPLTSLVGREHDVAEVAALLDARDRRLVVLTGAGGIGKTRLALAVMDSGRAHWRDGTAFVDLSSVTDAALVPEVIAAALGLAVEGREQPLDTLARRLADRHALVVLDNFEQVLEAAPMVADLIGRAPRLHVLVTSRVVLRVRGEREWRVEPLGVFPASDVTGTPGAPEQAPPQGERAPAAPAAEVAATPAVQLFVERAARVRPGFELTEANAAAVAELCRRLDGLPLALELAAAWMRLLAPEQMLAQLFERMERPGVLADLPNRQQTLTGTIAWSYDLLPEPARQLLTRLSVFAAPFTAVAAEAVCADEGTDVVDSLSTLLDHSMVSPAGRPDGEPGFRLPDAILRFAAARLDNPDDMLSHLERYLLGVLEAAAGWHGSQARAVRRLDSEWPEIQAVLVWAGRGGRPSGPLLRALGDVWVWLLVRGLLRRTSGLWRQIEELPHDSLPAESDQLAWYFLQTSGLLARGRYAQAEELLDRILPDVRRLEVPWRAGVMLMRRAIGRPYTASSPARGELEDALAIVRGTDDLLVQGYVLSHYGYFLCVDGDNSGARQHHEEMLGIARSVGDENLRAEAHYDLTVDALAVGDGEPARQHLVTAISHYRDIDHSDGLTRSLAALAALALEREDARLAAWLIGATAAARDKIGIFPWPLVGETERRVSQRVEAALPSAEFAQQVASGRAQTIEDALTRALTPLSDRAATATW